MSDIPKKLDPDFVVRLDGPGIRPWAVPMRALARILNAMQRLIDQKEDEEDRPGNGEPLKKITEPEGKILRLLDIRSSSASYAVAAPAHAFAMSLLQETGKGLKAPERHDWSGATLSSIEQLSEVAKSLGCQIEIRRPRKGKRDGDVLAKITPTTFDEVARVAFVYGRTTIFGTIERVGGATERHCGLRIPTQPRKMVICRVASDDLVRKLGLHIYQGVLASGSAIWLRHNGHLKHLEIDSFEPPKTGSLRDALDEIYEAGGSAWDKVADPDAFISEMRGK